MIKAGVVDNGARRNIEIRGVYCGPAGLRGTLPNGGGTVRDLAFLPAKSELPAPSDLPVGTPILIGAERYRITSANVPTGVDPDGTVFVRLHVRPDAEPWLSHRAAKELDDATLEGLTDLICAGESRAEPARSAVKISGFFAAAGLRRFAYDGSAANLWTFRALQQCTPDELVCVIARLASPKEHRRDETRTAAAIVNLNTILRAEGIRVSIDGVEVRIESVRPALVARNQDVIEVDLSEVAAGFGVMRVQDAWLKATRRIAADPDGAITSARSLLEEVCKAILTKREIEAPPNCELPQLYYKAASALHLAPDQQSEQLFREILGNCQSIVGKLAGVRNRFGDAHGAGSGARAESRHADLAVNLAGVVSKFLITTLLDEDAH